MGGRRALLAALLLLGPATARAGPIASRPLGLSTGGAFGSLFLEPTGSDARGLPGAELEISWSLANDWGAPVPLRAGARRIWIQTDVQTDSLAVRLRLPWAQLLGQPPGSPWDRLSTAVEARLVQHWGGWTDRPIETWHGWVGSTNFGRASFERDRVRVLALDLETGRGLRLEDPRLSPGDLVLRTQLLLAQGGRSPLGADLARWGLSARLDAKVPIGRPSTLGGSGGWDAGAALLTTAELLPGLTLHALAGATLISPLPASLPLPVQPLRLFGELSLAMQLGPWALLLEGRVSGPIARDLSPLPEVSPFQVEASAYYGLALAASRVGFGLRRGAVTFWLSEDWSLGAAPRATGASNWFYNSNAPDLALGLQWTVPLGAGR